MFVVSVLRMENISKEEKQRRAEELRKCRDAEAKERQRQEKEEEREHMIKCWDATKQFKKTIIKPSAKNKDPNGNKKKGYTVWCSEVGGTDGSHSCPKTNNLTAPGRRKPTLMPKLAFFFTGRMLGD